MLPDNTLIKLEEGEFLAPRDKKQTNITTWEMGGVALSDGSEGFSHYWQGYLENQVIYLHRSGLTPVPVLSVHGVVSEMNFTFDQNMNPCIAYIEDEVCKLYCYDSTVNKSVTTQYAGAKNPRLSLDDKRKFNIANSDIIFAYVMDYNRLCYRLQRERYAIERTLMIDDKATPINPLELFRIGMSTGNRFMFETE